MNEREKEELTQEKEEKDLVLEYMKIQNEALKRIYNHTVNKENNE